MAIITKSTLTIDELGKLAGLLRRYFEELKYEATDGAPLDDEDAAIDDKLTLEDYLANEKLLKIECVDKCLRTVTNDLYLHLS